ncbi:MAG: OmpH family outer membrane protein [Chitinophagaceae bacterium]
MKKTFLVLAIIAFGVIASNVANAQIKIGSFSQEGVLGLFPKIQEKQDSVLNKFVMDSLKPDYDYQLSELIRKDSTFKKDSATLSAGVRKIMQDEIAAHRYKIVNWQQYQNQVLEQKSNEFLRPYLQQVYAALEQIVVEQKFTHVLKEDNFVFPVPLSENLTVKVAQKLKLLTKEQEAQIKAQEDALKQAQKPGAAPAPKKN